MLHTVFIPRLSREHAGKCTPSWPGTTAHRSPGPGQRRPGLPVRAGPGRRTGPRRCQESSVASPMGMISRSGGNISLSTGHANILTPRCRCPIGRHPRTVSSLILFDRERFWQITTERDNTKLSCENATVIPVKLGLVANGPAYRSTISCVIAALIIGVDSQLNKEQHAYPLGFAYREFSAGFASIVWAESRRLKSPAD